MVQNITLENGCVKKLFFKFAIPSILGMLIVSLQIMVDGLFLSKGVGSNGLAAVNLSMPLINLLLSIALMICIGGGVLVGIASGNKDYDRAKGLTSLTLILLLSVLLIISIGLLLNFETVIKLLGTDSETYFLVKGYLAILIPGSIFFSMPIFTETFVRIAGKPNQVFISGSICFIVNVFLDYIFVITLGMGMEGAAIASCFANMFGALSLFYHIEFGKIIGTFKDIKEIFYNGSSEMLTVISSAITTYIFNIIIMKNIGVLGVSALTIVFYINSIVNISLYGLSQALQPIISYNLGANRIDKIKDVLKIALKSGASIGLITFIVMHIFGDKIVHLFSNGNKELANLTNKAVFFFTFAYLLSFINIISSSFHTSIEKPFESAFISCGRSIIFVLIPLFTLPFFVGEIGIWLAIPIAELICLTVSIPLMKKSLKRLPLNI
ncbi:MATE family efflux transporter [Cetobacterium somerae]|uniref:MATE family efflux transporter n=1 Tax=Cetobacterium sp. NK01 TaxID=2993530 RepID=UPI0021165C01|nr:MATE family efflux transporter [Cetobacterium sp. NK01]MCQ8212904.1 MATE family efflux transporter [Cetobacterium sp. NK01]